MLPSPIVVKLGGSLLDLPGLGPKLRTWLDALPRREVVLVVGGGPPADWLRAMDQRHHLGEEHSHWLALQAMTLTSHVVAALLPDAQVVPSLKACAAIWSQRCLPILEPLRFMQEDAARPDKLPASWAITSDSIAARVAAVAGAQELILLKSCALPSEWTWEELAHRGIVDAWFPPLAKALPTVRLVNFRGVL